MSNQWRVRWSIAAVNDLDEIIEYIALRDSPGAAARMHSTIVQQVDTLSTNARRGCIMPELRDIGVREFRELIVSPCRICFSIAKREVVLYSLRVKTPPHPDPLPRWGEGRVRGKGGFSSVTSIYPPWHPNPDRQSGGGDGEGDCPNGGTDSDRGGLCCSHRPND